MEDAFSRRVRVETSGRIAASFGGNAPPFDLADDEGEEMTLRIRPVDKTSGERARRGAGISPPGAHNARSRGNGSTRDR